jgi:hypothetical protein
MSGKTCVASEDDSYCWKFDSEFLLVSWLLGPNRLSGRYDRFNMHQGPAEDVDESYSDHGHAWTFAYEREVNQHVSIALEFLQIDSRLAARADFGLPESAAERELQLAVRLQL